MLWASHKIPALCKACCKQRFFLFFMSAIFFLPLPVKYTTVAIAAAICCATMTFPLYRQLCNSTTAITTTTTSQLPCTRHSIIFSPISVCVIFYSSLLLLLLFLLLHAINYVTATFGWFFRCHFFVIIYFARWLPFAYSTLLLLFLVVFFALFVGYAASVR